MKQKALSSLLICLLMSSSAQETLLRAAQEKSSGSTPSIYNHFLPGSIPSLSLKRAVEKCDLWRCQHTADPHGHAAPGHVLHAQVDAASPGHMGTEGLYLLMSLQC